MGIVVVARADGAGYVRSIGCASWLYIIARQGSLWWLERMGIFVVARTHGAGYVRSICCASWLYIIARPALKPASRL